MTVARVTQRMLVDRTLTNLSGHERRILNLQEQLSTGQRVNRPSDDPLAARRAVTARSEIHRNEQYIANLSAAQPFLDEAETAIETSVDILQRVNELTLQGASDTMGQTQRDQIAIEVNELLETMLSQANHETSDRFIFGGTRTRSEPFVATRDAEGEITAVSYEGNSEKIMVEVSEGVRVPANETGDALYTQTNPQSVDIFGLLVQLREDLRNGDTAGLQDRLAELDTAQDQLLVATARIGSVHNRFEHIEGNLRAINVQLEEVLSDNLDADFADVIVNLNAQSNAFTASLNASARVIQPSLLDFIG